jgi:hypothetical protein
MRFDADDDRCEGAIGEMGMNGRGEIRSPHAEGGLVNVADCRVAAWDIEFEGGIGVAEFLAELGG